MAAASNPITENISTVLECPVCMERFTDPRMLPCGHTFCRHCIEDLVANQRVPCPTCRQEHAVQPNNLPVNYLVKQLHELALGENFPMPMRTITDEKVKKYLDATDKAIMQLAFCDAAAQLLGEFTHQTMQNVAQVDMEMIESIREVIKSGSPDATILDAVEEISYATSTRAEEFATSTVWKRIHTIRAEVSNISIIQSLLRSENERKHLSIIFSGFMRYPSNMQQCADYIVEELQQWTCNDLQTCIIGNGCSWWIDETADAYIAISGIMKMKVVAFCGDSMQVLQNAPTRSAVDAVLPGLCQAVDRGHDVQIKLKDALNEKFPSGWNCVMFAAGETLVVSFPPCALEKLMLFQHNTSANRRFIVWAWKQ